MSIILKGNSINFTNNGITPNEATNIMFSQNSTEIRIIWENPKDVIINDILLSKFDHLVIVRKQDSVPLTPKDGTIIYNGSSSDSCKDTSVVSGNSYYYRFFVYDSNKNINNSANMIFKQIYNKSNSIANLSWKEINEISESGKASSMFNIGDEINVNLLEYKRGDDNEDVKYSFSTQTVTLQIWDFDHFDRDDKNGKAGIVFGMKNLMKDRFTAYHFGCWAETDIKNVLMDAIYNRLPEDCKSVIKPVKAYTAYNINYNYNGSAGNNQSPGYLTSEKVFIPGAVEMGINSSYSGLGSTVNCELNQKRFPIFTDNNSRIKNPPSGSNTTIYSYLLRSSVDSQYNGMIRIWNDGSPTTSMSSGVSDVFGLCFCFNV